jgi:hypothetical protein
MGCTGGIKDGGLIGVDVEAMPLMNNYNRWRAGMLKYRQVVVEVEATVVQCIH